MPFVRNSHDRGVVAALERYGFKRAAEELRLKLPRREFHGWEAAHKNEAIRGAKKADAQGTEDVPGTADNLEKMFEEINTPAGPAAQHAMRDPLDRSTAWGAPSNMAGGDAGSRLSDMGQNTSFGGV